MRDRLSPKDYLPVAIVFLLAVGVYWNSLSNGFVYDDKFAVLENPWISDAAYLPEIMFHDAWGYSLDKTSSYYRPMMLLLYMTIYHLFGLSPWGFHLVNILFHASVSALAFLVARRLLENASGPSLSIPFITALLFAVHPVHTEAVAWVSGIPELSYSFFYLLSIHLYLTSTKTGKISAGSYILSVVSFFLSALSKEPALTLPVLLLAYDYAFGRGPRRFADVAKRYLPYVATAGAYLALRITALGRFAPVTRHADLSGHQLLLNVFPLFARYLETLLLPTSLNAFHVFHPSVSIFEPSVLLSSGVFLAFLTFLVLSAKRAPAIFLSLLFLCVPLLPALYIPAVGENAFAERYLYLPSFGFLMLPALLLKWCGTRDQKWTKAIFAVLMLLAGAYSFGTIRRNADWRDDYSLWADTVRKSPDGSVPHNNLGNAYKGKGLITEAMEEYRIAIRLDPSNSYAHANLASTFQSQGLMENAIAEYLLAIRLNPRMPEVHSNLGVAYKSLGLLDEAMDEYRIAISIDPGFAEARNNLGNAYKLKGFVDQAVKEYEAAVRINPAYHLAYFNLGEVYHSRGALDKAADNYEAAARLAPDWELPHLRLGPLYFRKGDIERARREFEKVLAINPWHQEARRFHNIITQGEAGDP